MPILKVNLTEEEHKLAISALLFSCSVNVVSNTSPEFQENMLNLAKKLRALNPNVKLTDVQFIQESDYEEAISEQILERFKTNIEVTTFECV